jgi:hypothetical protein
MFSRKLSTITIPAVGLALLTCGGARANLVTNGDFAAYTGTAPKDFTSNCLPTDWSTGGYVYLDAPGTAVTAPGIQVWGPFPAPPPPNANGNFIESDGSPSLAYPINQTISGLTVGQSYSVSFVQAAGQEFGDSGTTTEQWQVSLGSNTQLSAVMNTPSQGVFPWESQTLTYTANSTSEVLSFLAVGGGGVPPIVFLDGVDMEANVPEPSAGLLLAGVGTVVAMGRLGRRAIAKASAG